MSMTIPLAEQFRPQMLDEIVGQDHLIGKEGLITKIVQSQTPLSLILWGPPGCGKTSIARLYAKAFSIRFVSLSATFSGIADIKKIVQEAEAHPLFSKGTLLFVDEIHRFNKAQQDAFLPFVEKGTLILVGATTENPSFHLNNALLSRVRVLPVQPLDTCALTLLLEKYEKKRKPLPLTQESKGALLAMCQGDGRYLFNLLENIQTENVEALIDLETLHTLVQNRSAHYDRGDDQHYNLISALHKSVRGSDPDASLYWLARMLEGGEGPLYIARRMIRMAVEDIGLADPQALTIAIAARDAYEMLGSPEGELALAQTIVYLALAPKSNSVYTAFSIAQKDAKQTTHFPPPATILNAPTTLMKSFGYGKGYQYDHDTEAGFSGQEYFPQEMERKKYYSPIERGFEREMKKRLEYFERLREKS